MHIIAQSVSKGKELILVLFIWRGKTAMGALENGQSALKGGQQKLLALFVVKNSVRTTNEYK